MYTFIFYYIIAINVFTFAAFGVDKRRAKHHEWRIPERQLILLALLGGSVGGWLGMSVYRHKTQHKKFHWGIPLIFIIQIVLIIALCPK